MKKYYKGKYIEMTPEEIESLKEQVKDFVEEHTTESRLEELEKALTKVKELFNKLGVRFE